MDENHIRIVAEQLQVQTHQVRAVASLLEQGATVPFIARYRKEATGSLDEVAITTVRDELGRLKDLDDRRSAVLRSLEERSLLTEELKLRILGAETLHALEDLYLPFRPKKRSRAAAAREKGLEPLALRLLDQDPAWDPEAAGRAFLDPEKGVETVAEALSGARDIVAEWVNEDAGAREDIRELFRARGVFRTRVIPGMEDNGDKFRDYFDWEEPVRTTPSHRILAMRRGAGEGFLTLRIAVPDEEALGLLERRFVRGDSDASRQVREAVQDGYKRLLAPAMETEIRLETKKRADDAAIRVFAENLRGLLMAPPLGRKNVLALDPGIRTGAKLTCLDRQGRLLHWTTVFPLLSSRERERAATEIRSLCGRYQVEAVAVGNGTGGRETEEFLKSLALPGSPPVILVSESGASVYSTSEAAREEFQDLDATVRGSVSIGRRLMDPLAELVKIDPKSIGVGQYQHDVDQKKLKRSLDDTVVSCVNAVGVELNTSSVELLTYVSGLGPRLARNIVAFRNERGPFRSREELKRVPQLGPKAFEQAAGFLRIRDGEHPLDAGAVHPESYKIVYAMARDVGASVTDLIRDEHVRSRIDVTGYVTERVGIPTLSDILSELARPGRDPRRSFDGVSFSDEVRTLEDLKRGMILPGVVTNVTAFGAFVDIGVHQDGLVHISQLADKYVREPGEIVRVHQQVNVTVLDVDHARKRIALSMKKRPFAESAASGRFAGKQEGVKAGSEQTRTGGNCSSVKDFNKPFAHLLKDR